MTGALLVPLSGDGKPKLIGMYVAIVSCTLIVIGTHTRLGPCFRDDGLFAPAPPALATENYTIVASSSEGLEMDASISVRLELHYTFTKAGASPTSATYAAELPRFDLSARQISNATEYCVPLPEKLYSPMAAYDNLTNFTRTISYEGLIADGSGAGQIFDISSSSELAKRCYSYNSANTVAPSENGTAA